MICREEDERREAQTALAREQALELVKTGNADVEVVGTGNADVALVGTGNVDETDASHSTVDPDVEHRAPDVADASKDTSVANHGVGHPDSKAPTPKLVTTVHQHSVVASPANNKCSFAKTHNTTAAVSWCPFRKAKYLKTCHHTSF